MKLYLRTFVLAVLALCMSGPFAGYAEESKNAFAIYSMGPTSDSRIVNHIISFPLEGTKTIRSVVPFYSVASAGAYADGVYYIATTDDSETMAANLVRTDLETDEYPVTVGNLSGLESFVNDMSYDYSTHTMYAIAKSDNNAYSSLYKVNLENASCEKVATMDRKFFTLACSYDGQLYAISFDGDFCTINKETGAVRIIGITGYQPELWQTMEFDHATKTLYWSAIVSHADDTVVWSESFLATVDVKNGHVAKLDNFDEDVQLAGLYIPFLASADDTPAAVTGFAVVPDGTGKYEATLSWTYPTTTFGGSTLSEITKLEILRDGEVIETFDNPQPGATGSYTDVVGTSGGAVHAYRVVAYNGNGIGTPAEWKGFVGTDVPAAPRNLILARNGANSVTLSWERPEGGQNGGYTDIGNLTYKIVRMPDETVLKENVAELSYTDNSVQEIGSYYYCVTAKDASGNESEAATSESLTLGPSLQLPYDCSFSANDFDVWQAVDHDGDGNGWVRTYASGMGGDVVYYTAPSSEAADDWLVSHCFDIVAGATYKVDFSACSFGESNVLEFYLLEDSNPDNVVQLLESATLARGWEFSTDGFTFTAEKGGSLNFAIKAASPANSSIMYINSLHIEQQMDVNLACLSVAGTDAPVYGRTYPYRATIANRGNLAQNEFTVRLKDGNGIVLATQAFSEMIEAGSTVPVTVNWNVMQADIEGIVAEVECDGDGVAADNTSPVLAVAVQPSGAADKVAIGTNAEGSAQQHPFNLYNSNAACLNIYDRSEIGFDAGWIRTLMYDYNSVSYNAEAVPVKIYMANTELATTVGGWIPEQDMTLVYDGTVDFVKGSHKLEIPLQHSFHYDGGNLAILTTNTLGTKYYMAITFPYYTSPLEGNNVLAWKATNPSVEGAFDFSKAGSQGEGTSAVCMLIQTTGYLLSGIVTDDAGTPLEGVVVTIEELNMSVNTDADGNYSLDFVPEGSYTVTASLHGYPNREFSNVEIGENVLPLNIKMTQLSTFSVSGKVVDFEGNPLEGATVTIDGYDMLVDKTDAEGVFRFGSVVKNEGNTITVGKDWYKPASKAFDLTDSDLDLGNISLDYHVYPPVNAKLSSDEETAEIVWDAPNAEMQLRKDNGVVDSQFGISNDEYGTSLLGTIFRTPMKLKKVQWQTTSEGGPHYIVNLYIYDLDEEGNVTDKLLYSERTVRNTDNTWMDYELPEAIDAPRGCCVALNYEGFLGIAIDDASVEYPFAANDYVFSSDFNYAMFSLLSEKGLNGNLHIRASGTAYPENMGEEALVLENPEEAPSFWRYKVWRLSDKSVSSDDWTLLTNTALTETSFSDSGWNGLAPGVYRYAVCMEYPDGTLSEPAYTAYKANDMLATVTVKAKTNAASASAEGADVVMTNDAGKTLTAVIGGGNEVVLSDVWKGVYTLKISKEGYEPVVATVDFSVLDNYETEEYLLKEIIADPYNLRVVETEEGSFRFTWNETGDIRDDFESHPDFMVASPGEIGWNYYDGDKARTYAWQNYDFPNRTMEMSFIVFNPSAATPAISFSGIEPHSGSKYMACFTAIGGNDDYMISPKLRFFDDFTFRFFAKGYTATYPDSFRVGYSSTGKEPEDFVWITESINPTTDGYTEYSYTIPAEATYVALNCNSTDDGFVLMVDDMMIGLDNNAPMHTEVSAPEVSYEVYLDGKQMESTENCMAVFAGIEEGEHTASVKAVYNSGNSETSTITFNTNSGVEETEIVSAVRIYPNPASDHVTISGDYTKAELLDLSGRLMASFHGNDGWLDVSTVKAGMYLLVISNSDLSTRTVVKLQIKR